MRGACGARTASSALCRSTVTQPLCPGNKSVERSAVGAQALSGLKARTQHRGAVKLRVRLAGPTEMLELSVYPSVSLSLSLCVFLSISP